MYVLIFIFLIFVMYETVGHCNPLKGLICKRRIIDRIISPNCACVRTRSWATWSRTWWSPCRSAATPTRGRTNRKRWQPTSQMRRESFNSKNDIKKWVFSRYVELKILNNLKLGIRVEFGKAMSFFLRNNQLW